MNPITVKNIDKNNVSIIILAAGMGKRMKSNQAKVLHKILGRPMILYVLKVAKEIAGDNIILVIGNQGEEVRKVVSNNQNLIFVFQDKQLGTGHAVLCALPHLPEHNEQVVILCGDVPLISADTILKLIQDHVDKDRDVSLLAVEVKNSQGYGRILLDGNRNLIGIIEESDATNYQKQIRLVNTGIYCVRKNFLVYAVEQLTVDNVQGEYYLTDIIKIACQGKKKAGAVIGDDEDEFIGINTPQHLQYAETIMRNRIGNLT